MSLLRSLVRGVLFFYKDVAPTELKKNMNDYVLVICVHPCLSVVLVFA